MPKKQVKSPRIEKIEPKHKIDSGKVKTIILALVIAIVLCAFVIYLIQAIHPSPRYENYCNVNPPYFENITKAICESNNGNWTSETIQYTKTSPTQTQFQGYCNFNYKCEQEFRTAQDNYNLVVFIVAVIVGIIAVAFGIVLQLTSVSSGLMLGGAFLMFYGTMTYWEKLSNWIRVIILGIALAILIWLGYKKLKS